MTRMLRQFELLIFMILTITTYTINALDNSTKCSDFKPNICGPNAKCIDDENNWKFTKYGGPFCECNNNFVGKPPNCKIGCGFDYECESDEYCTESNDCIKGCRENGGSCEFHEYCDVDTRKCTEGCKSDFNCISDEYCNIKDKKCQKICENFSCGENSICAGIFHAKHCGCAEGYVPEAGKGCVKNDTSLVKEFDCTKSCGTYSKCNTYHSYCYCDVGLEENPLMLCKPSYPAYPVKPGGDYSISLACVITICTG